MRNILILDADGTQTLEIAKSLYKNDYNVHAFCNEKFSYGYHTRYIHTKKNSPSIKKEAEYLEYLLDYIQENNINVLFPMADNSAAFISKYKTTLINVVKFVMPDHDIFSNGYNKSRLMSICENNNFPHPKTIFLDADGKNKIDNSIFPALIKPNITCGARGMTFVNNADEFERLYPKIKQKYGDCHLQEFIQQGGAQVEVQILVGANNELLFSSVIYKYRWYPENAGSSCCNVSVKNEKIVNICYELMKVLNWKGFADFDTLEDPKDGELKIMELNPRVPACVRTAIKSGIDWGNIIIDEYIGKEQKRYEYIPGKKLRHIGFEFLWFYYSPNRFKTKPNWFNFFERNLYFQDFSWDDPFPFIWGTIGNVKKQINPKFRDSKSGTRKN
jgi:predicted ATP-grasp superfamily ATP-dependent carboligase